MRYFLFALTVSCSAAFVGAMIAIAGGAYGQQAFYIALVTAAIVGTVGVVNTGEKRNETRTRHHVHRK